MKRKYIFMFALVLALMLCACAVEEPEPTPTPKATPVRVDYPNLPTADESAKMADFMRANRAIVADGRLYAFDFDSEFNPVLISAAIADGTLSDVTILAEKCLPSYLSYREGCLYYINESSGNCVESLPASGGERKILSDPNCSYLSLNGDSIYYCDAEGYFCRSALDGSGKETLLDTVCCYAYLLGDTLLYQREDDSESLHYYSLKNGADEKLTAIPSYAPVAVSDKIYFTGLTEEGMRICSVPLDGGATVPYQSAAPTGTAEFYLVEDTLRASFITELENTRCRYDTAMGVFAPELLSEGSYRRMEFCGEYRVETDYWKDGRIRCFVLTMPDGTEVEYVRAIMSENG